MGSNSKSPTEKKQRVLTTLSDAQDEAIEETARRLERKRGTFVSKAAVAREALNEYCQRQGVAWPAK